MSVLTWPILPSSTSIRLFTLTAGNLGDPVVGSLSVVDLEDRPAYECVSYTWGTAAEQEEIIVNGFPILIRRHLWEALRRMRLSMQPRVLWIDAICISQDDLDEKARQVQMIGKIVHHASRVLAWLGEHADGSEAIFRVWPTEDIDTANMSPGSFPPSFWIRRIEVWLAFCSRRWFSRTWIIQEVAVAKEVLVLCGEDVGHWTTLFENLLNRAMNGESIYDCGAVLDGVKSVSSFRFAKEVVACLPEDLLTRYYASFEVLAQLGHTRRNYRDTVQSDQPGGLPLKWFSSNAITSKCLDRRDKIYALRSLLYGPSVEPSHGIPVDYTIDVVELMIRSLDCGIPCDPRPHLSWVLVRLLELSDDEVEAAVNIIASQPSQLNRYRISLLAYVCITDARTPKEVTSKFFGIRDGSSWWLYNESRTPGYAEKLLRLHSVRRAGGDMYSLLELASDV